MDGRARAWRTARGCCHDVLLRRRDSGRQETGDTVCSEVASQSLHSGNRRIHDVETVAAMDVHVDEAGQDKLACRIDPSRQCLACHSRGNGGNLAVLHDDCRRRQLTGRCDDAPVFDQDCVVLLLTHARIVAHEQARRKRQMAVHGCLTLRA